MSEGSNESGQVCGVAVASDRSPPPSPALALPPGQVDGQGTVRPHQFSNSRMSPQNPLDRYATQDPRLESSDPTSASHLAFMLTSLEEVAAQRSIMAADQLGREEPRAIRHATLELHGRVPGQVSENSTRTDNGDTNPGDERRGSCSVGSSPPQNLVVGIRRGDSDYGQTMLTPIGMTSYWVTVSPAGSGNEAYGAVTLANHKDTDIINGRDIPDTSIQRDTHRVSSCTTHISQDPDTFLASDLPAHLPSTPSTDNYSDPSQPTINSRRSTPSYETEFSYQQHNCDEPSNITQDGDVQHGPSQTAMQASDVGSATGLHSTNVRYSSFTAQDGIAASLVFTSAHTSNSPIGQHGELGLQGPPDSALIVDDHENTMLAVALDHDFEPVILNAAGATGISNELDIMGEHLPTSPEIPISSGESSEPITANTGVDIEMIDHHLSHAQDHGPIVPPILQQQVQQTTPVSSQLLPGISPLQSNLDGTDVDPLDLMVDDFERNLDVSTLLEHWTISYGMKDSEFPPIGERALRVKEWKRPDEIQTKDLDGDLCDPQGINWVKLGTTRAKARTVRNKLYVNYTNIKHACPSEVSARRQVLPLPLANI